MNLEELRVAQSPETWERKRIKHHVKRFFGGGTPSKENPNFWTNGSLPWVTAKDMKRIRIDSAEDFITEEAIDKSATNLVQPGSVLMVVRSGILKHSIPVAINDVLVTLNQDLKAIVLKDSLDPMFFVYWVMGQQRELLLEWSQLGATVDSLDVDVLRNTMIATPTIEEQREIVRFLDEECQEIGRVIDKVGGEQSARNAVKGSFLSLLVEKRIALISAAVTGQIQASTYKCLSSGRSSESHIANGICA